MARFGDGFIGDEITNRGLKCVNCGSHIAKIENPAGMEPYFFHTHSKRITCGLRKDHTITYAQAS